MLIVVLVRIINKVTLDNLKHILVDITIFYVGLMHINIDLKVITLNANGVNVNSKMLVQR